MEGESDDIELTNLTIGHTYQFVAQRETKDDEYYFCVFPKTWNEHHLYASMEGTRKKKIHLRCVRQGISIRLPTTEAKRVKEFNQLFDPSGVSPPEVILEGGKNGKEAKVVNQEVLIQHIQAVFALNELKVDHVSRRMETYEDLENMDEFNLHTQFIRQLKPLLNDVKRSYMEVTRSSSTLQGRLTSKGRRDLLMKPSARFECTFDEFSINSPIYQVLATCVEQISTSSLTYDFPWFRKKFAECRRQTRQCQRKLVGITPFNVQTARQVLRRLIRNLPRSFRGYESVLRLGMLILSNASISLNDTDGDGADYRILHKANSADIWEAYLVKGLKGLGLNVQEKVPYDPVWQSKREGKDGKKEIDITLNFGEELIDAKFYQLQSEADNTTLTASNQHQMFYYLLAQYSLHLHKGRRSPKPAMPKRITLIRPLEDKKTNVEQTIDIRQMVDEPMRELIRILNEKINRKPENFPEIREISVPLAGPEAIQELLDEDQEEGFESNDWVTRYLEKYAPDLKKVWKLPR